MVKKIAVVVIGMLAATSLSYAADAAKGKELFVSKCAICHGADASANTSMGKNFKIRNFRSPEVQKQSDAELTTIIAKGKGKMPTYADKLSADEISNLVAHIREVGKQK